MRTSSGIFAGAAVCCDGIAQAPDRRGRDGVEVIDEGPEETGVRPAPEDAQRSLAREVLAQAPPDVAPWRLRLALVFARIVDRLGGPVD